MIHFKVARDLRIGSLLLGLLPSLFSCGSGSKPINIAGNWTGTVTDSSFNLPGPATLSLTEDNDGRLTGVFSASSSAADCDWEDGPLGGRLAGVQVSLSQVLPNPSPTSIQATLDSTDQHLNGTYSFESGVCGSAGTLTLSKQ